MPPKPYLSLHHGIRYKNLFENKTKVIKPFNLNEIKINPKIIHNTILPKTAINQ